MAGTGGCGAWTHRTLGVLEENLCAVWDTELLLWLGARAVDARGRLGGVATHESGEGLAGKIYEPEGGRGEADVRLLVEEKDICTALEKGVRGGKTSETATDDDDLSHCDMCERVVGAVEVGRE